jgi:hypothetical protein
MSRVNIFCRGWPARGACQAAALPEALRRIHEDERRPGTALFSVRELVMKQFFARSFAGASLTVVNWKGTLSPDVT